MSKTSSPQPPIPAPLSDEAIQIADERVVCAVLDLLSGGGVPRRGPRHSFDGMAGALVEVARSMPGQLHKVLRADAREREALLPTAPRRSDPSSWLFSEDKEASDGPFDASLVDDDRLEALIGDGLRRQSPAYALFLRRMRRQLQARAAVQPAHPSDANVAILSRTLDLAPAEEGLLRLAVALAAGTLTSAFECIDPQATPKALDLLLRRIAPDDALGQQRLQRGQSALLETQVIGGRAALRRNMLYDLDDLLRLNALGRCLLLEPCADAAEMAARLLQPVKLSAEPPRPVPQWPHLQAARDTLLAVLRGALATRETGVNVLLHGPSGTGKTLFVTELLRELGRPAFSVSPTDPDEDDAPGIRNDRLASLRLCQRFAPTGDAVLLLDEAEDVFSHDPFGGRHPLLTLAGVGTAGPKAWLNQMLENNPRPVVWISNRIDHMDPAYLRRFTLCVAFPATPFGVRRSIAQQHLAPAGCSPALIEQAAAQAALSPAHLATAADAARLARDSDIATDDVVHLALTEQLKTLGQPGLSPRRAGASFDPAYLNLRGSPQPQDLLTRLPHLRQANLLFRGPPGTGKTELAGQIARQLGRELVTRTAADLHSMWFGESERQVAALFEGWDTQGELLLIDEADALLGSRGGADAHRAGTAVLGEFLRRMETHAGLLVCATNHAAALDPALMRRFMFRLDFLPLTAAQRLALLAASAGLDPTHRPLNLEQRRQLDRLDQLTPGDFTNVARRAAAMGRPLSVGEWLAELQAEHEVKPGGQARAVGFV